MREAAALDALAAHLERHVDVAALLRIAGRAEAQIRADVAEMLRWVGLEAKAGAMPASLSGGEQQRVQFARVLAQLAAGRTRGVHSALHGQAVLRKLVR